MVGMIKAASARILEIKIPEHPRAVALPRPTTVAFQAKPRCFEGMSMTRGNRTPTVYGENWGNNRMASFRVDHSIRTNRGAAEKSEECIQRTPVHAESSSRRCPPFGAYCCADGAGTFSRLISMYEACIAVFFK